MVEERNNFKNRQYYYNDSIELITVPYIPYQVPKMMC
jgi:hypothetical protein